MYIKISFVWDKLLCGEFKLHVNASEPYNEIIAQINHPRHLNPSHYEFFFIIAIRDAMEKRYPGCEMKATIHKENI